MKKQNKQWHLLNNVYPLYGRFNSYLPKTPEKSVGFKDTRVWSWTWQLKAWRGNDTLDEMSRNPCLNSSRHATAWGEKQRFLHLRTMLRPLPKQLISVWCCRDQFLFFFVSPHLTAGLRNFPGILAHIVPLLEQFKNLK